MADKDLVLKLRLMNYLWRLGYLVFKNVEISSMNVTDRKTFTDIDVLGIRFSTDLVSDFIICDCKTGKVKNAERLFWLSGVMKFFDASKGIFIRPEKLSSTYYELAERLNIIPLTNNQMDELEKAYNIDKEALYGQFISEQDKLDEIWKELKKDYRKEIRYLLIDYWKDIPQQQILTLFSVYKNLNKDNKYNMFIHCLLHSLLSISITSFSRFFLTIPFHLREDLIQKTLLGGELSYYDREQILTNFYIFMTNEISARYNQKYPVTKKDFISGMIPSYAKYLIDLIIRICNTPEISLIISRYFNLYPYKIVLLDDEIEINNLIEGMPINNVTMKPIKDFITFLDRSNILTDELKQEYNKKILNIEKTLPTTLDYYGK